MWQSRVTQSGLLVGCAARRVPEAEALSYVLGYGARFVAQGTPADMTGLASMIEEGIRYPGFAFINVQSPCITYGQPEAQLKAQKGEMQSLASLGHDPADRTAAFTLAQDYGRKLYTGVFYRDDTPAPTYEQDVLTRQAELAAKAVGRDRILDAFVPR